LGLVVGGGLTMLLGGASVATGALGRQSNFTGRTDIWAAVIYAAGNPVIGTGFESFWISPNQLVFARILADKGWWHPEGLNEAHDGYLEVYLNLGWIGVCLMSFILIGGYRRAIAAFRLHRSVGGVTLAYIIAAAVYSITEAGFRMMDPMWIFLLLAVVSANGVLAGFFDDRAPKILASRRSEEKSTTARNKLIPERKTVYAARPGLI
jgi:O-antigen ligase